MRISRLVAVIVLVASASCGGASSTDLVPVSREQATIMADLLHRNLESGGAEFVLTTVAGPNGGTISISGQVDWVDHKGRAEITSSDLGSTPVTEVWWTKDAVFERRPKVDGLLSNAGLASGPAVIVRPVDLAQRRLDQLIAVLIGLASTQPENAELILQTEGTAFVRSETLRGSQVEILRYGQRTLYWVDVASGKMLRFEGVDESGRYPVVIDIMSVGKQSIADLGDLDVVDFSDLPTAVIDLSATSP
jgi:hypothetical protein